jgi:hypothetical protein
MIFAWLVLIPVLMALLLLMEQIEVRLPDPYHEPADQKQ